MEQSVTYCSTTPIPCGNCYPAEVILCVPQVLTVSELGSLDAVLVNAVKVGSSCGQCAMQYTFTYDTDDLADPTQPLTNLQINGVVCKSCLTRWVEDAVTAGGLTGWETDESGNFIQKAGFPDGRIIYTAGDFGIFANTVDGADNLKITIGGGGVADSARGAQIVVRGNDTVGAVEITGGAVSTGDILLNLSHGSAKIKAVDANGHTTWDITNGGDLESASTYGGNIVFNNSSQKGIRYGSRFTCYAQNNGIDLAISGGSSNSSADGSSLVLQGSGLSGVAELAGAAIATGHVKFYIKHASAQIQFKQQNDRLLWYIDNSGQLQNDATFGSNLIFNNPVTNVQLTSGSNGRTGTFTMNGATPVVVSNTSLSSSDVIQIFRDTPAGTPGAFNLTARTNGASFTVTGTALDTSGMRYILTKVN